MMSHSFTFCEKKTHRIHIFGNLQCFLTKHILKFSDNAYVDIHEKNYVAT